MLNRLIIVAIFATLITGFIFAMGADAGDFYQWTDSSGAISFTDDAKQIPAKYKTKAVERDFADLSVKKVTPENTSGDTAALDSRLARLREANALPPRPARECEGHVTVTSDRIQVGDYNTRVFIVRNECGETVSVTPFYPSVQVNR